MLDLTSNVSPSADDLVIVGGGDDNFAIGIAVTLYSALVNLTHGTRVFVFVLDGGILPATKERLYRVLEPLQVDLCLRYVTPDASLFRDLKTPGHLTVMTYLRLTIPDLFPDLDRVVYLDTDLVVNADLGLLWEIPLGDNFALAVREMGFPTVSLGLPQTYRKLGLDAETPYFNAGIMVMNLRRWREERVVPRVLAYTRENEDTILCADQDGINAVIAGRWREVDPRWNVQVGSVVNFRSLADTPYKRRIEPLLPELSKNPYVLHFIGRKPWQSGIVNPARPFFVEYLKRSGWFSPREYAEWQRDWLIRCLRRVPDDLRKRVAARLITFPGRRVAAR
jgi:lipopolysaccharide biosynthesis glycosyltransferase